MMVFYPLFFKSFTCSISLLFITLNGNVSFGFGEKGYTIPC